MNDLSVGSARVPLSFGQDWLWRVARAYPSCSAYHVAVTWRLHGDLDISRLGTALTRVMTRHSSLRTTFHEDQSHQPYGLVRAAPPPDEVLRYVDLTTQFHSSRVPDAQNSIRSDYSLPFLLTNEFPVRARLYRVDSHEYILSFIFHHIAIDAWSTGLLINELSTCYADDLGSLTHIQASRPQHYQFAFQEISDFNRGDLDDSVLYWHELIKEVSSRGSSLGLEPHNYSWFDASSVLIKVPSVTTAVLTRLGVRAHATLFTVVVTATACVLSKELGNNSVVVSTAVANRTTPQSRAVIGSFAHHVLIPVDVEMDRPFGELVEEVGRTCAVGFSHHRVPLEKLVQLFDLVDERSSRPWVRMYVGLLDGTSGVLANMGGLAVEHFPTMSIGTKSKWDLSLVLYQGRDGLRGTLKLAAGATDRAGPSRLAADLGRLFARAAAEPAALTRDLLR